MPPPSSWVEDHWLGLRAAESKPTRLSSAPASQDPVATLCCYHAIALKKLVIRASTSLDSAKLGSVKSGTRLTVLAMETLQGCCKRAKVGMDTTPRGVAVNAIGWVTAEKDGEVKLKLAKEGAGLPKSATIAALKLSTPVTPAGLDPSFSRLDEGVAESWRADGGGGETQSMAARIAERRRSRRMTVADVHAQCNEQAPAPAAGSNEKPAVANAKAAARRPLQTSTSLQQWAEAKDAEADADEKMTFDSVSSRIGFLLNHKGIKIEDLMKEWDRNNDGDISKQEFRLNVRKLGIKDADATTKQLDDLYESVDFDGSDALDMKEIKTAVETWKAEAVNAIELAAFHKIIVASKRTVAEAFRTAADVTALYEAEQREHEALREGTLAYRLGSLLKQKNVKVAEVVSHWSTDANGSIPLGEFVQQATLLGLKTKDEEEMRTFYKNEMDINRDGNVTPAEMITTFKRVVAAVYSYGREVEAKRVVAVAAKKKAEAMQMAAQLVLDQAEQKAEQRKQALIDAKEAKIAAQRRRAEEKEEAKRAMSRKFKRQSTASPGYMAAAAEKAAAGDRASAAERGSTQPIGIGFSRG